MGTTTFSGPLQAGTVREGAGDNLGKVVLSQTNTIAYTDTTAKDLFILPANAQILDFQVDVTTAFNSSGTDLLDIGKDGAANHFADNLDVSAIGRLLASSDASQLPNYATVGTTDLTIQGIFVQSVADASTGAARITVTYVQN